MNLNQFAIALLLFSALGNAHCRAIDDVVAGDEDNDNNDVDNSIEAGEEKQHGSPFEQDWLKFTKEPPLKIMQPIGGTVEIPCEIMGSQVPTIQWAVGHLPMSEIEDMESNALSENTQTAVVRVRSVHVIDHLLSEPHTYTCVGRSGAKTIYASTIVYPQPDVKELLHGREKPYSGPQKPRIIYSEKLHMDLMGSNVLLPCKVHSRPHAEVFWMNNDGRIIDQSHRYKVLPTGDLLISNIKWEDMGSYKCIARNAMGKDMADTFVYPVLKERN